MSCQAVQKQWQFWQCVALPFLAPLNVAKALLLLQPFVLKIRYSFSAFALSIKMISFLANKMSEHKFRTFLHASSLAQLYLCPPSQLHFAIHHCYFVLVVDKIDKCGLTIQDSPFCSSSPRHLAHPRCAPCLQIATELNWTSSCQLSLAASESVAECHSAPPRWRPPSRTRACDLRRLACDVFATADSIAVAAPPPPPPPPFPRLIFPTAAPEVAAWLSPLLLHAPRR